MSKESIQQAALDDPNMPEVNEAEYQEIANEPSKQEIIDKAEQGQADSAPANEATQNDGEYIDPDKLDPNVQARFNKLTAEKYAERRKREEAEKKLAEYEKGNQNQSTPQTATEPTLEQFDYDEEKYQSALIDFKVQQGIQNATQNQQQTQQNEKPVIDPVIQETFNTQLTEFQKQASDYQDVIQNIPELPDHTFNAVMQAGPKVAYYLGKHLDIADELASLDPVNGVMKIGQISAQLSAKPQPVKTSAAPEPIEPIGSGGGGSKSIEEMSMEEIYNL